jgi:uncharacterized protein YecE (DUF72 family)
MGEGRKRKRAELASLPGAGDGGGVLPRVAGLARRVGALARQGVYLGTSSWKYPGWLGQVYDPVRYAYRGRLSQRRFEQTCLEEYARVFPTVGGDFSFYQFPSRGYWDRMFAQVPDGFRFGLKVPEDITVERFPKQPRYGQRAGENNPSFLDAGALRERFLAPLEPHGDKVGVIMFEFGTFYQSEMRRPSRFAEALAGMLDHLPRDRFRFAVEVRNTEFLKPGTGRDEYLACLREHGVAHCLNSWTRMPSIGEQLEAPGVLDAPHAAARCLLRPGRSYQQAVDAFAPYEHVQDPYAQGRRDVTDVIRRCLKDRRMLFVFVNNRFEGNAIETIEAVLNELDAEDPPGRPTKP